MPVMPLFRALFSALTFFGGHFLNRRIDRIVLIGAMLAVAAMVSIGAIFVLNVIGVMYLGYATWVLRLPLILVLAVALLSAGLTFVDARQAPGAALTPLIRATRVPLSLFGVLVLVVASEFAGVSFMPAYRAEVDPELPTAGSIHFGYGGTAGYGATATIEPAPPPPSGPERLRGRVTLDGAGVEGAEVALRLNGASGIEHLKTDSRGVFEARLPAGKWFINKIFVSNWDDRPKHRNLILFSGHERANEGGWYSRFNTDLADGFEVSLPAASNAIPVEIEFRDALAVTWPLRPKPSTSGLVTDGVQDAELSTAAVAWEPVEGATEYQVQIGHFEREGGYSVPILTRRLSGLSLPLASLPQRPPVALEDKYSVRVFAFDAKGRLLTESSLKPESVLDADDRMFKLTGATRLGRERQHVGRSVEPQVISAEYELNEVRLRLADNLLDQKRLDDARRVLDQVTKDAPRAETSVLRGRLAALQGDCVTADKFFDQAECESGCAPLEHRKLCEAP